MMTLNIQISVSQQISQWWECVIKKILAPSTQDQLITSSLQLKTYWTAPHLKPKCNHPMVAHHHLPPLFHLPLVLAWWVSSGQPDSTKRKKTSSNTERNPDFALENMSKSCWQPSHFHMTVFPSGAARLWRMVTHAWAVIISHAGVSRGSLVLPCCSALPWLGRGFSLMLELRVQPHLSPLKALPHQSAREHSRSTQPATRQHGSATPGTVQGNTYTQTLLLSLSLTLSAATAADAMMLWSCCWIIFLSSSLWVSEAFLSPV